MRSRSAAVALLVLATVGSTLAVSDAIAAPVQSASLIWQPPQLTDARHGFTSVSCVAKDLCRAGDAGNRVQRWDGVSWHDGDVFSPHVAGVRAMTCTSRTFCAAIQGFARNGVRNSAYRPITRRPDGTWNQSAPIVDSEFPSGFFPGSISCSSAAFCMMVDGVVAGVLHYAVWNGSKWSALGLLSDRTNQNAFVSCTSPTLCRLIDSRGRYWRWDGTSWTAPTKLYVGDWPVVGLDCVDSSFCMLVTDYGFRVIRSSGWSDLHRLDKATHALNRLSCATRDFCIAVRDDGRSYRWDGKGWTGPHTVTAGSFTGTSCSSPGFCVAVTEDGDAFHRVNGSWQAPRAGDPATGDVSDLSCDSPQLCVLVDEHGNASAFTGSAWTRPNRVTAPGQGFGGVSCGGDSFCIAGVGNGDVRIRRHGVWGDPIRVTENDVVNRVSCGSPTLCGIHTELYDEIWIWDGSKFDDLTGTDEENIWKIKCAPDGCVITYYPYGGIAGSDTYVYRPDGMGSGPSAAGSIPTRGVRTYACASVSYCAGVGNSHRPYLFDGSAWRPVPAATGQIPNAAISCATTTFCVAVGRRSESTWDGTQWSAPQTILDPDVPGSETLASVSCKRSICAAATRGGWTVVAT